MEVKNESVLDQINKNVYTITEKIPSTKTIKGHDFSELENDSDVDFNKLFNSFNTCGIQASHLHDAITIINNALDLRYARAINSNKHSST